MLVALQTAEFLGFVIDTVEMTVSLPERKIIRMLEKPIGVRALKYIHKFIPFNTNFNHYSLSYN